MAKSHARGRRHKRPDAESSSKQLALFDKHKLLDSRKPQGTWGIRFGMLHCGCGGECLAADRHVRRHVSPNVPHTTASGDVSYTAFRAPLELHRWALAQVPGLAEITDHSVHQVLLQ